MIIETTCEYLNLNFKGSVYMEGSGIYDHSIVSAMWKLGGSQELLDTYRKALDAHGMDEKILSPALRFTTSDVAASGANLYPMLLTDGPNGVISLGSPIKLAHDKGIPVVSYIAPSAWAWNKGRAKNVAKIVDKVACIFPFEYDVMNKYRFLSIYILDYIYFSFHVYLLLLHSNTRNALFIIKKIIFSPNHPFVLFDIPFLLYTLINVTDILEVLFSLLPNLERYDTESHSSH